MTSGRFSRWVLIVGALFAVALFSGSSCGDARTSTVSIVTTGACPNVILQASLPVSDAPDEQRSPADGAAGACLFVVMALAGLALAGAARRPLLVFAGFWWARLPLTLRRHPALLPSRMDALRI